MILLFLFSGNELFAYNFTRPSRSILLAALNDKNPNHEHPRLYARSEDFVTLRQNIRTDPQLSKWFAAIKTSADKTVNIDTEPFVRDIGSVRVPITRSIPGRMYPLLLAYQVTLDKIYANRAIKEMLAISAWEWYGADLKTGDIMQGLSVGYDWCYDILTPEQRTTIRNAIITKGLTPIIAAYNANPTYKFTNSIGNVFGNNNWNPWINGAASACAMAIGDEEPTIAGEYLERALVVVENFAGTYGPDGASVEGPGYGNAAMNFYINWIACMESALGTSYNYFYVPGIPEYVYFTPYMNGPVKLLNFHDSGADNLTYLGCTFFIANKLQKPGLGIMRKNDIGNGNGSFFDILWYRPDYYVNSTETLPLDRYFGGLVQTGSMRTSFNDRNALCLLFHGGENNVAHTHLDIGQFNIDAMGLNWALDLGTEDATYQAAYSGLYPRYSYYRLNPGGHNTLLIDPSTSNSYFGQSIPAYNPITKFVSDNAGAFAILDMTKAYQTQVNSAIRGYALTDNRSRFLIQDEVDLKKTSVLWWNMHTRATIEVSNDGKTAILTQLGKRMIAKLVSPADGKFQALKAEPLPESYQVPIQTVNTGIQKLAVKLEGVVKTTIVVELRPVTNDSVLTLSTLPIIPLAYWSEPRENTNLLPSISYEKSLYTFGINKAITPFTPINTGGTVPVAIGSGYRILPNTLPIGLTFNNLTGEISGTPTTLLTQTTYTVTAFNAKGSGTAKLVIQVLAVLPPETAYPSSVSCLMNSPMEPIIPVNTGGEVAASGYYISPQLPAGLNFNATTGVISGTPTGQSPFIKYNITASNVGGQFQTTIYLRTASILAPKISYPVQSAAFSTSISAITPLVPINSGGSVPASTYGTVSTVLSIGGSAYGLAFNNKSIVYAACNNTNQVKILTLPSTVATLAGSGYTTPFADGTGTSATFNGLSGIAIHPLTGDIFVADATNNKIRKITSAGVVTTFAGTGVAGSADGTMPTATFSAPRGLCFDTDGTLYVLQTNAIRAINASGFLVSTISTALSSGTNSWNFSYLNGYFYVSELSGNKIEKVSLADGSISVLAGKGSSGSADGMATEATFNAPRGIVIDNTGTIYVADYYNHKIRRITTDGTVTTIAGSGTNATTDGVGTAATFRNPAGLTLDGLGNLYVADVGGTNLRKVVLSGYTISPTLPDGLVFDCTTGVISGTPMVESPTTDYIITAYNGDGGASTLLTIETYLGTGVNGINSFENPISAYTVGNSEIRIIGEISMHSIAKLYDVQGRSLLTKNLSQGNLNIIPLQNAKKGIYLLSVKSENQSQCLKITIR